MLGPIITTTAAVLGGGLIEKVTDKITSKLSGENVSKIGKVTESFHEILSKKTDKSQNNNILDYIQTINIRDTETLNNELESLIQELNEGLSSEASITEEGCYIRRDQEGNLSISLENGDLVSLEKGTPGQILAEKILALEKLRNLKTSNNSYSIDNIAKELDTKEEGLWKINFK